jgi:ketosteroid isomerase-like protein
MSAFYARWIGSWDEFAVKPVDFIDAGDDVIAIIEIRGTGKASGAAVTMQAADVYTVAGGKVVRQVAYPDAADALEAAGLRE